MPASRSLHFRRKYSAKRDVTQFLTWSYQWTFGNDIEVTGSSAAANHLSPPKKNLPPPHPAKTMWHNQSCECANCIFQQEEDLEVNTLLFFFHPLWTSSKADHHYRQGAYLAGNAIMAFRRVALGCYDEEYYEEIMRRYYAPIRKFCVKVGFCWSFKNWSKLWWRSAKEISTFIPSSCQIITIWKGSVMPVTCQPWFIATHARTQKCPIIDP